MFFRSAAFLQYSTCARWLSTQRSGAQSVDLAHRDKTGKPRRTSKPLQSGSYSKDIFNARVVPQESLTRMLWWLSSSAPEELREVYCDIAAAVSPSSYI